MADETPDRSDPAVTRLLQELARGEPLPDASLIPRVVEDLKAIARGHLARQRSGHTLQPSALVNEAYLEVLGRGHEGWSDRSHFFALAARAMRQILVDHARKQRELGRGGGDGSLSIREPAATTAGPGVDALDLHTALEELAERDPRQAQIVELKYFAGLEVAEVAAVLGVSKATVEREWRVARAWLGVRLRDVGSP